MFLLLAGGLLIILLAVVIAVVSSVVSAVGGGARQLRQLLTMQKTDIPDFGLSVFFSPFDSRRQVFQVHPAFHLFFQLLFRSLFFLC